MERRDPAAHNSFVNKEGRGEMIKSPVDLQDLRRRIYVKAKAEFGWERWSSRWLYEVLRLFDDYRVRYLVSLPKGAPADGSHNPCREVCRSA